MKPYLKTALFLLLYPPAMLTSMRYLFPQEIPYSLKTYTAALFILVVFGRREKGGDV
jgi:hypothetical protein